MVRWLLTKLSKLSYFNSQSVLRKILKFANAELDDKSLVATVLLCDISRVYRNKLSD